MIDPAPLWPTPTEIRREYEIRVLTPLIQELRDMIATAFRTKPGPVYHIDSTVTGPGTVKLFFRSPAADKMAAFEIVKGELANSGWMLLYHSEQRDPDRIEIRPTPSGRQGS